MKYLAKNIITSITLLVCLLAPLAASAEPSKEYLVKAAFIYNFTKFIEWNKSDKNINICTVGENKFGSALKQIEKRSNAKIKYKIFTDNNEKNRCDIYIYSDLLSEIKTNKNILTIGEGEDFIKNGGIISFIKRDNKIKFIINHVAAKEANLRMNPQLLEIADKVVR